MNTSSITRFVNRAGLKLKKNSPQILFVTGVVGVVGTTVLASRATLKAVPVVEQFQTERASLESALAAETISSEDYSQAVGQQYGIVTIELLRLYAPAIVVGVGSLTALTKSHRQLMTRNTALNAAYTGLLNTFQKYRSRVREEHGIEADRQFLHGSMEKEIEVTDKNGTTKTKSITTLDSSSAAALSFYFDDNCKSWTKHVGYNQATLDNQQDWANIQLQRQGHLFLNEVYDLLQIPHTKEGNILGWVYQDLGDNDTFVTFGHQDDPDFVAGYTKDVMLNFNIHGPILDLI